MNKIILLIPFLLGFISKAQHCPYDNAFISVLKITAAGDTATIDGLRLSLLDSNKSLIIDDIWNGNDFVEDTIRMWQNPPETTFTGYVDNLNPLRPEQVRFWFAKDNYVNLNFHQDCYYILIEDIDGEENGGEFQDLIVPVREVAYYPLCTGMSNWDSSPAHRSFVKGYAPHELSLQLKK